jgi:hypothetical protein
MTMGIDCKVCISEKREYIEQLIIQGNSNLMVSTTLKDMGVDISHASINRHKNKHMPDNQDAIKENAHEKGNRKYDREDSKNSFAINANKIYEDMESLIMRNVNYNELAKNYSLMLLMLNRIVNNQLAITIDLQEKYMKGESKYPNEQIRGLQIVQDLVQKFEVFSRQNFEHYKQMMNNSNGMLTYIYDMGKKAKKELNIKTPYNKGDIFRLCVKTGYNYDETIDKHSSLYRPFNPFIGDFHNDILSSNFDNGVKENVSDIEKKDLSLYDYMRNIEDDKLWECTIKRLAENDYDIDKERVKINKMKMISDNEDEDEDEDIDINDIHLSL